MRRLLATLKISDFKSKSVFLDCMYRKAYFYAALGAWFP
jgi:hypothetical protein